MNKDFSSTSNKQWPIRPLSENQNYYLILTNFAFLVSEDYAVPEARENFSSIEKFIARVATIPQSSRLTMKVCFSF